MIVKIKSHKKPAFRKLLDYMLNEKDRLYDRSGNSFCITYNIKGSIIDAWEKQLKENESYRKQRRSNSVYFTHEILSWHRDDAKKVTLEKMEVMTREYIRLRNQKGIFVAVPHFDKEHYHIHILASGVEYKTGKSMRMSKEQMQQLKKGIQAFQQEKFPELNKSVVNHDKIEKSITGEKEYQIKYRGGREMEKDKVITKIKDCFNKASSKEIFFQLLNESGLKTYQRNGKITGIILSKYKFRFKRLGFTERELERLDKVRHRKHELVKSRTRGSIFNIQKGR